MKILITAPSLDPTLHVNGISMVVQMIVQNDRHDYIHYCVGKKDGEKKNIAWLINYLFTFLNFPIQLIVRKIDAVHLNVPFDKKGILRESIFALFSTICRRKIIAHFHGGEYFTHQPESIILKKIISVFLKLCHQIIVLNESEAITLKEKHQCSTPINIIPNSVSTQIKLNEISDVIDKKKENSFIFLGRITKEKGIIEIVDALKLLSAQNKNKITFYLCGVGPLDNFVVREMSQLHNIEFHHCGVVTGKEKVELLKHSSFFLLPSYFEGLPVSLLEAMATATIPIVSEVGAMKSIVNAEIGFKIKPADVPSLFQTMSLAMQTEPNTRKALGTNCVKTIDSHFDEKDYILKIEKVYSIVNQQF